MQKKKLVDFISIDRINRIKLSRHHFNDQKTTGETWWNAILIGMNRRINLFDKCFGKIEVYDIGSPLLNFFTSP